MLRSGSLGKHDIANVGICVEPATEEHSTTASPFWGRKPVFQGRLKGLSKQGRSRTRVYMPHILSTLGWLQIDRRLLGFAGPCDQALAAERRKASEASPLRRGGGLSPLILGVA